jgi:hypothetical protein
MLNPYAGLQGDVPPCVTARTRAYAAYGAPVIHGSVSGMATAGLLSDELAQKIVPSWKFGVFASWNS